LLPYLELALAGSLFVFWSSAAPAIVAGLICVHRGADRGRVRQSCP
jgi:hypothetical protein